MNLTALLASLLQPLILKPVNKGATWLARQTAGPAKGDQFLEDNAPIISVAEGAVAGSLAHTALSQVGASHIASDKLAAALGIPTTEQSLTAALGQKGATLDLSNPAAVLGLLSQTLVK